MNFPLLFLLPFLMQIEKQEERYAKGKQKEEGEVCPFTGNKQITELFNEQETLGKNSEKEYNFTP